MICKKIIDELLYCGSILSCSNYLYCYIMNKNFIHVYYKPYYALWISITYGIILFRYRNILINHYK